MPHFIRRHAVKLAASAAITLIVIYTARRGGLTLVPQGHDFSTVRWGLVALYVPALLLMQWFRCTRWRFLLRSIVDVPTRPLIAVSLAGFLAVLLLPFRLGELVRPYMMHRRTATRPDGRPALTMTTATSAVVAERIIDGLYLGVILAIVLVVVPTIHPLPDRVVGLPISVAQVRAAGFLMVVLFSGALATIAVFYFARSFAQRVTRAIVGIVSKSIADKLADLLGHAADGLHVFRRGRDALGFFVESTAYWLCSAGGLWLMSYACGIVHADGSALTFAESCGLLGLLGCTMLIPGPPGLVGVFQVGLYAGMTMYVPREIVTGPGAAFVFLVYTSQFIVITVTGLWGVAAAGGASQLRDALDRSDRASASAR